MVASATLKSVPAALIPEAENFLFNKYKEAINGRLMPQDKDTAQFLCFMMGFAAAQAEMMKRLTAKDEASSLSSNE